ncbi:hypothetical protein LOD99_13050 [Oopsacas minuta]|uniref:Thioredoxin-like fold domain-containing protein n=1 Tax=Oopsacas minuta TaxID=111878 RepID=A0AAV7JAQ9_9METZ|nr:hypothetical protein LOD99_13050 [Oopsacas minuta]
MILLTVTFAAILSLSYTIQTPQRQLGYPLLGNRTREIFIDVFYDNICEVSAANWPLFSQVISQEYLRNTLGVAVHIFPLPYHHNSFFAAWAGEAVIQTDASKYRDYMTYVFKNYDDFISKAVNLTEGEVHQAYAKAVEMSTGIKAQVILDGYKNRDLDLRARLAWKYGCYRGVSGTPTFMVNDVEVPEAGGFNLSQWNSFLRNLLG